MNLTAVEFRRGWPVLFAAALGTAFGASPIPFNSAGPFTKPLAEEFGWGRGDIQLALFWFTAAVVLTVPFMGGLADRIGVRKVAIGTPALFGITFAALAFTPASLFAFYLLWILMGALGGGSTPVTWTRAVNAWFEPNRGLALALTLMGTGVTAAFLPSLATWVIEEYGWRKAFLGISLLPLAVALSIRPGKPVIIGLVKGRTTGAPIPVFGLPGHQAAVSVCFDVFVKPVLVRFTGAVPHPALAGIAPYRTVKAKLSRSIASSPGREDHVRVTLEKREDGLWARPVFGASGLISTLVKAVGTVVVPVNTIAVEAGEEVEVRLF